MTLLIILYLKTTSTYLFDLHTEKNSKRILICIFILLLRNFKQYMFQYRKIKEIYDTKSHTSFYYKVLSIKHQTKSKIFYTFILGFYSLSPLPKSHPRVNEHV